MPSKSSSDAWISTAFSTSCFRGSVSGSEPPRSGGRGRAQADRLDFNRFRANDPVEALRLRGGLYDSIPVEVATPLWKHRSRNRSGELAYAVREIPEAETEAPGIAIRRNRLARGQFCFPHAPVLLATISKVFPRRVPGGNRARHGDGNAFVHEMLSKADVSAGIPVGVVASGAGHGRPHLTPARRRRIPKGVRVFMRQPQGYELRVEPKPAGGRILNARKVLEGDESNAFALDDELACVRCADSDHENDIDVDIGSKNVTRLELSCARQCDDIGALENRAQV